MILKIVVVGLVVFRVLLFKIMVNLVKKRMIWIMEVNLILDRVLRLMVLRFLVFWVFFFKSWCFLVKEMYFLMVLLIIVRIE